MNIQAGVAGTRERGNILELRRLERAEDPREIAHHADIGAVIAIAALGRRRELEREIGGRADELLRGIDGRRELDWSGAHPR